MSETVKKGRLFDLPETKGLFQIKGIVSGVEKDGFYKELRTRTNKDMRTVNFGVEYDKNSTLYVNMQGIEQDNVYFYKSAKKKGEKAETVKIPWADRFSYNREGFRLIGKNIGVKKKVDSDGKVVNDKKNLTDFDACKEVSENLKDEASIFVKGNFDYSGYTDDNGNKKLSIKLSPNQISLCADVNFDDKNFDKQSDFNQVIIFMGIDREKINDKPTGRFITTAKIVTYNSIEDVEFIVTDEKLANKFKKTLKPYNAIKVSGHIAAVAQTETVEDDDWGEADAIVKTLEK